MELGQIVKLYIPHFKKERYYLVYQISSFIDFTLLNITDRDKRESIKSEITQHKLRTEITPGIISLVNLNTEILINDELLYELIDKLPQQNKNGDPLPSISREERVEIIKGVKDCFSNKKFRGNRYKEEQKVIDFIDKEITPQAESGEVGAKGI
ncbi:11634_t:CDS:2 [Ambispora leptoticha]|uniref:11634_t:CDS:1 n=1 Tax=Ambispora leptoticha TaxID=144679 RepID=A0A9N9GYJ1_9GLOM|nr:11634_t:CDS:2 [Ambispora leptoticha]